MNARWSSVRFRRRFFWIGGSVTVLASAVAAAVLIGNTAAPQPDTRRPGTPWIYRAPKIAHLSKSERVDVLQTSMLFIQTAVARKHLERAYDITGPDLLQGMSRREWLKGNIPVVPFPVAGVAAWNVIYSYVDDIGLQFSLLAKPGTSTLLGKTFTIELKRPQRTGHWQVVSWSPTGITSATNDTKQAATLAAGPPPVHPALAMWWLLLPASAFAAVVLIPAGLGIRSWYVGRKAERQYLAERGY